MQFLAKFPLYFNRKKWFSSWPLSLCEQCSSGDSSERPRQSEEEKQNFRKEQEGRSRRYEFIIQWKKQLYFHWDYI